MVGSKIVSISAAFVFVLSGFLAFSNLLRHHWFMLGVNIVAMGMCFATILIFASARRKQQELAELRRSATTPATRPATNAPPQ